MSRRKRLKGARSACARAIAGYICDSASPVDMSAAATAPPTNTLANTFTPFNTRSYGPSSPAKTGAGVTPIGPTSDRDVPGLAAPAGLCRVRAPRESGPIQRHQSRSHTASRPPAHHQSFTLDLSCSVVVHHRRLDRFPRRVHRLFFARVDGKSPEPVRGNRHAPHTISVNYSLGKHLGDLALRGLAPRGVRFWEFPSACVPAASAEKQPIEWWESGEAHGIGGVAAVPFFTAAAPRRSRA
jgi:hypothetical protein